MSPATLRYFALAFFISWVPGLLVAAILQAILPDSMDRASLLVAKYGPSIAGIVMAAAVAGRAGVSFLVRAATRVRENPLWIAVSLLAPPVLFAGGLVLFQATGGDVAWSFLSSMTAPTVLVAFATFTFLGGGFGEELGWRGFALPMMQRRMGALTASLVLGVVWAAWHYPAILLDRESKDVSIVVFTAFVLACAVIMTWLFNSTRGNVLLAVLFHASFNATESMVEGAVAPDLEQRLDLCVTGVFALAALVVVVTNGPKHLARRPRAVWPEEV